jgi:uncharacterized cofD-like protein
MSTTSLNISKKPKIVVIGGGTGTSVVLSGLKSRDVDLTAIVTAFDSGGSSGRLRDEFGHLSLGDLRQCLVALSEESEETEAFRTASQYRFSDQSSLNGHNLGNLFLSALTVMHADIELALKMMSSMLRITGSVVPVSLDPADLCAELVDGSVLRGEATIDLRRFDPPPIRRVFLDRDVQPNELAIKAISEADAIVLGPGDLYTSVIPNLLVNGVSDAIRESSAKTIYVCNLMTKHGETDGFNPPNFVSEISRYLGNHPIDTVLVNSEPISAEIEAVYARVKAVQVNPSAESGELASWSLDQRYAPLGEVLIPPDEDELRLRHDPALLADEIMRLTVVSNEDRGFGTTDWGLARSAD